MDKKPQPLIVHNLYRAVFSGEKIGYSISDGNKVIGYTNCNRLVIFTNGNYSINIPDIKNIVELSEMCNKELLKLTS